jgi:hypothetical protein
MSVNFLNTSACSSSGAVPTIPALAPTTPVEEAKAG